MGFFNIILWKMWWWDQKGSFSGEFVDIKDISLNHQWSWGGTTWGTVTGLEQWHPLKCVGYFVCRGTKNVIDCTLKIPLHSLCVVVHHSFHKLPLILFFISQVFYLFEPLYHVQLALLPRLAQSRNLAERRVMLGAARDLLRSLYHCHLNSLESYIRPRPANHSTDKLFRRGASKGHLSAVCPPAFFHSHNDATAVFYV